MRTYGEPGRRTQLHLFPVHTAEASASAGVLMSEPGHVPHPDHTDPSTNDAPRTTAAREAAATTPSGGTRRPRHLDCSEAPHGVDGTTAAGRAAPAGRSTGQPRR